MPVEDQEKEGTKTQPASEGSSFWRTLPGVLTAVASLLTAIAGLVLAIHQLTKKDASGDPNKKNETHAVTSATQGNSTPLVSDKSRAATETQPQTKSNVAAGDTKPHTPPGDTGGPPGFPPETQKQPPPTEDELASRTSRSLPGDVISDFRFVGSSGLSLTVAVHYAYNPSHSGRISARATAEGVPSGTTPIVLPSPGPGVVNLPLKLRTTGESTQIVVCLYEPGQPLQPFAERRFPFRRQWTER